MTTVRATPPDGGGHAAAANFAGSLIIQAGLRLSRLVSLIAAAYVLGTADFAALVIGLAVTDLARATLQGFDVAAVRARAGAGRHGLTMGSFTGSKVIATVLLGLAVTILSQLVYGSQVGAIVAVLSAGVLPGGLASLWIVPRQVDLRLLGLAPAVILASVATVVATIAGAVTAGSLGVAAGLLVGDLVLLGAISVRDRFAPDLNLRHMALAFRETPRLMVQQLGYVGQFRFGTLLLGLIAAPVAVAEYSIASRLAEGLVIASTALTATSYPMMARAHAAGNAGELEARFVGSYWLAVGMSVAMIWPLIMTLPIWLPVLFPKYPGAAVPFALVGVSVILFFANGQTTALLNTWHRDTAAATAAASGFAMTAIGTLLLAAPGAAVGVSIARIAGEAVRLAIETVAVWRERAIGAHRAWGAWIAVSPLLISAALCVASGWRTDVTVLAGVLGIGATGIATSWYWPRVGRTIRWSM